MSKMKPRKTQKDTELLFIFLQNSATSAAKINAYSIVNNTETKA